MKGRIFSSGVNLYEKGINDEWRKWDFVAAIQPVTNA